MSAPGPSPRKPRLDDPYQGMRREPGFENLWVLHRAGYAPWLGRCRVLLFIFEATGTVRCNSLGTLSWPA